VDGNNSIIAGHGRLLAARKLGYKEVPTIELSDLTETQKKAYIIADNRLALNAGWDNELLTIELNDLLADGFALELLGFDPKELDALLEPEIVQGLTDEDAVPDLPDEPTTKLGDIYQLGNHRLMCGDSTSIDAVDKLMDGQKANMLHTDPPYGVDYEGITNDHLKTEALQQFLTDAFVCAWTVMHDGSNVYIWHADITAYEFIGAFRNAGFKQARPSTIQWVKDSLVMSQGDYHSQNEPCLYGWKEGKGRVRVADRKQTTIWRISKEKHQKIHPTMKPIELCERAILNSSMPNSIVLDLFGGSGSTLIACEKQNRHARLMELDPKYCDVIVRRWEDFTGKKAVLLLESTVTA
jgi:DNA modification methylase